ncbi:hypothetical protein B0H21DRAFT_758526 [Amylocystis lapponica]|nr:hypothetical protein B0H21DRAFT_758526 [Amylocystis lapponica]
MPSLIPLDNILGALLIGVITSTLIYGITCLQVYLYYTQHCTQDNKFQRIYVAIVWIIDSCHTAFLSVAYYHYTVTNFGDYNVLAATTWSLLWQVILGALCSGMVQAFFAWRVYSLSGRKIIVPALVCLLCLAQLSLGIGYLVEATKVKFFSQAAPDIPYTTSSLSVDIACDTIITVHMIYYLLKNRTPFYRTNKAITLLINYSLNTCLLTTVCTLICFVLVVKQADTLVYAPFYFILVRLYSCSLMSTLNSRDGVRQVLLGDRHELVTMPSTTVGSIGVSEIGSKWPTLQGQTQTQMTLKGQTLDIGHMGGGSLDV